MIPKPLTQPWLISEEGMRLVLSVWSRGDLFTEDRIQALAARQGEPLKNARATYKREGVAVIPVNGPLMRHASMFSDISGATAYEDIRKDLQAALDDPQVTAILLNVSSPGGEADGVGELADAISGASKPVTAYVGGYAASAAYWLAASASWVVCAETAFLGCIGTRIAFFDTSKAEEMAGLRSVEIVSSQTPDKRSTPVDDEVIARLQARADGLTEVFIGAVARYRGVTAAAVATDFGRGDVLMGRAAVAAGLADQIGNFEAVLADLVNHHTQGAFMNTMKASLGLPENATDQQAMEAAAVGVQARKDLAALVAALGAKDADDARGKAAAAASAAADLGALRADRAREQATATQSQFRAALTQALGDKRLTLGQLAKVVPTFLDDAEGDKAAKAVAAVTEQTSEKLLEAVCSAQASAGTMKRVTAFLSAQGPQIPAAAVEPPTPVGSEYDDEISKAAAQARVVMDRNKK